MTVQELIDQLLKVPNKQMKIVINASGEFFPVTSIDVLGGKVWIECE